MKQGTKGDGTKAYELLLKVPRTPTFGISPEKKLVDRFLEMVKYCSSLRFTFNQHFVFQQGGGVMNTQKTYRKRRCVRLPMDAGIVPLNRLLDRSLQFHFSTLLAQQKTVKAQAVDERW